MYCDQEPLRLLNVIEDDCCVLGVHIRLSTRCKIFFTLKSLSLTPTGVIVYARASFPSCVWLSHPFVVRAISSILKLLEFLRCDAPVSQTLAWWQRLLTHVSHESSYPVVDWGNSYKPLFSSQGEYRFTFSYRHIMNSNRVPKQKKNHYYIRTLETESAIFPFFRC